MIWAANCKHTIIDELSHAKASFSHCNQEGGRGGGGEGEGESAARG